MGAGRRLITPMSVTLLNGEAGGPWEGSPARQKGEFEGHSTAGSEFTQTAAFSLPK